MPSNTSSARGFDAERAAARKYGLEGVDETTGYYDLFANNGVKYQVKSAMHTRASGNPGRFRFWREHLERLHAEQSAVLLVLTSSAKAPDRILKIEKVSTGDVLGVIGSGWVRSGHQDEMGAQRRVPWPELVDL